MIKIKEKYIFFYNFNANYKAFVSRYDLSSDIYPIINTVHIIEERITRHGTALQMLSPTRVIGGKRG